MSILKGVVSSAGGSGGIPSTGGTPNSVIFYNASGDSATDNNNLSFFDSSNGISNAQLNIGTGGDNTGTDTINIYGQADAYLSNSVINGGAGQVANLTIDGLIPGWTASSSRGTGTSPVILNTGDFVGAFGGWGYTGASPSYTPLGLGLVVASGATASNLGGQIQWWTKADGGVLTQRWTIGNDGGLVGTSAAAMSFAVGSNGATNPVFQVDSSVASQATGLVVQGRAVGGGVLVAATSSGTNEFISVASKGTSTVNLSPGGSNRVTISNTTFLFTALTSVANSAPAASSGAATLRFNFTNAADTTLTASTEATWGYINMGAAIRSHAAGNITVQRDFRFSGTTHNFVSASTITDLAAVSFDYGNGGANSTITNLHAIYIPTAVLANTTNGYGITIQAPTGATNNYAANLNGPVIHGGSLFYQTRSVTAAGAITVSAVTDYYIGVNKTVGAATTVNLPAGVTGLTFVIKDEKGDAAINNITIIPAAGNIDNAGTKVLNLNLQSATLFYNGTQWTVN